VRKIHLVVQKHLLHAQKLIDGFMWCTEILSSATIFFYLCVEIIGSLAQIFWLPTILGMLWCCGYVIDPVGGV